MHAPPSAAFQEKISNNELCQEYHDSSSKFITNKISWTTNWKTNKILLLQPYPVDRRGTWIYVPPFHTIINHIKSQFMKVHIIIDIWTLPILVWISYIARPINNNNNNNNITGWRYLAIKTLSFISHGYQTKVINI